MEYKIEFLERRMRTPTAESYRFQKPADLSFTAGQYMEVDLGEGLSHPLSLSNCPGETRFIEFTKRMSESLFSKRLKSLVKGDSITVEGPFGEFCVADSFETTVMIAGGIGITPFISMLNSLEKKKEHKGKVILLYGNLNKEDIAFRRELDSLKLLDFHIVHVLSEPKGMEDAHQGFITADIISQEVPNTGNADYMVSGPPVMVEAIRKALTSLGVTSDRMHFDVFLGY